MKKILIPSVLLVAFAGLVAVKKIKQNTADITTARERVAIDTTGGYAMLRQRCFICHAPAVKEGMNHDNMQAPPMPGVKMHYLRRYPRKEDFVRAVREWVKKPDKEKSLMPGAIKKFGLMPAFPYPDADLEKMAAVIYDRIHIPKGHRGRGRNGRCGGGKCGGGH